MMTRTLHRFSRATSILSATALVAGSLFWLGAAPAHADTTPPAPPANLRLLTGPISENGVIILNWDASASNDVAYYQIFRYNGTSTAPTANELTYVGNGSTSDTLNLFVDTLESEGTFRYAVMAVDAHGNASLPTDWISATVDLPGNGRGVITPDVTPPPPPTALSLGAQHTKNRNLTLNFTKSSSSDLWRYLVYRQQGSQAPEMLAYLYDTEIAAQTLADIVTADGTYTYTIKAQDRAGNVSQASAAASIMVDTTAPVVSITTPAAGQSYAQNSTLTIAASVVENGSGYEASTYRYYLNGAAHASPTLNLSQLALGLHTVKVEVTDRAGNTGSHEVQFIVGSATGNPQAPRNLTAPAFSKSRQVTLNWEAPQGNNVTGYQIYRVQAGGSVVLAGSTAALSFTDTTAADGSYAYYVVAQRNGNQISQPSNVVAVTVDTVAPAITVTAPKADQTYVKSGTLTPVVSVTDATSGVEAAAIKYYLDGVLFTGTSINLANLSVGSHTFKVEATDRAGNMATRTVSFKVALATNDDDDDDDDDDDKGAPAQDLIDMLIKIRNGQVPGVNKNQLYIQHGQYTALMAKAKNGNVKSFVKQVIQHRGKHISEKAADLLLEAAGAQNPFKPSTPVVPQSNGKGNGKK